MKDFYLLLSRSFKQEGQSTFLAPAVSQVPLSQNNQHARVPYFGMRCSELLQYQPCWNKFAFSEQMLHSRTHYKMNSSEGLDVAELLQKG